MGGKMIQNDFGEDHQIGVEMNGSSQETEKKRKTPHITLQSHIILKNTEHQHFNNA